MISSYMVLAAGLGKRMLTLTETCPKPLLPFKGKTLLQHIIDKIPAESRIVMNTHYLGEQIQKAVSLDPRIIFSPEEELLETGGGIEHALPLLGTKSFFSINSDEYWEGDAFGLLEKAWDENKMDVLLLLISKDQDPHEKGDFFIDREGRLSRRGDKDLAPYIYVGLQILHPRLFEKAPGGAYSINLLYDKAISEGRAFGVIYPSDWYHIGSKDAYERFHGTL